LTEKLLAQAASAISLRDLECAELENPLSNHARRGFVADLILEDDQGRYGCIVFNNPTLAVILATAFHPSSEWCVVFNQRIEDRI